MGESGRSRAVFPGSFDPITNGHVDIIARATSVFDELIVAVLVNPEKSPLFSVEERVAMIRKTYRRNRRVRVDTFSGLLVDYAAKVGAKVIVRGLRAISDFEFEFQMALMNRRLNREIQTVFLMTGMRWIYTSSSIIKEAAQFGGDIEGMVPPVVLARLKEKFPLLAQSPEKRPV